MAAGSLTQMLRQIVDSDTLLLAELPLPKPEMAMFENCGGGLSQASSYGGRVASSFSVVSPRLYRLAW